MAISLPVPRARLRLALDARYIILGGTVLIVAYLTAFPLFMLVWGSLKTGDPLTPTALTLENFIHAYADPTAYELLANSMLYALGTCVVAFVLGTSLAWIIERTNTPFKSLFFALTLVPLIIPGILNTIAWIFLLSARIGWINRMVMGLFNLERAPFDVFSLPGMMWVEGLHLSPLVFVMMTAAFRSMDPALEEAAVVAGAGIWKTFRRITLPLVTPTALSVLLIMFIRGLESFEVPALVGLPVGIRVFTSRIYIALKQYPPNWGLASAYSVSLLLISTVGILLYHRLSARSEAFATVTGKGYRPRPIDLGRWRYVTAGAFILYFLLLVGLPVFILFWFSLTPFSSVPSLEMLPLLTFDNYLSLLDFPRARTAFINSFILGTSSATLVMALTAVIAWISLKSRWRGRQLLDLLAFLPITFPGLVLAVSLMWLYLVLPIPIYGTLWILLVAYATRYMPYGIRANSASMLQISKELEEAGHIAGASWLETFRRITLPLLKPGLIAGWVYIVVVSMRELSTSVLLYSSQSLVLSVLIWDMWDGGNVPRLAALAVTFIVFMVLLVFVAHKMGGRFGVKD